MIYILVGLVTLMTYSVIRVALFYSKKAQYNGKAKARVIYFSKEKREVLAAFKVDGVEYGAYNILVSQAFAQSSIGLFFSKNSSGPSELDVFYKKGEPEDCVLFDPVEQVPYKHIFKVILMLAITVGFVWWKL